MKTPMDENEILNMNRSFKILYDRRKKLLEDDKTQKLRERVKEIRHRSINHLEELKVLAVEHLQTNGVEVVYAEDSDEALEAIYDLVKDERVIAKSKSNTTNEIGLTDFLAENGVEVVETDLGDRIVQFTAKKKSSHPIGPAAHLDMKEIAQVIREKFSRDIKDDHQEILEVVREDVLAEISKCKVGITGANSVAADDGSMVMVHNEGNISLLSLLDTHIVVVGIDKLVETLEDAISVVKLETIYATGKTVSAYINVVSSPSKTADIEQVLLMGMYGAKRVVVVLLDNGRSKALKDARETLLCIGCGSCIISCPIYNVIGYEFGYGRHLGGRGVVFSRYLQDKEICFQSGLYTCTLCGQCTRDCPMEIPTSELMEKLRRESVESGLIEDKHSETARKIRKNGSPFK